MRIEVLDFDGCPNYEALLPRLHKILERTGVSAEIDLRRIASDDAAQRERFLGSPTVRINGRDVEPEAERRTDYGLKCRLYPCLSASEQWIALTLIRQLALGAPGGVSRLASVAELSEGEITNTLDHLPGVFRDEERRVVGFMGLTVAEMGHHRIHVDGRPLSAWCAWDTLFLPELLGETAYVTSRSPTSDTEITLTVTATGPTEVTPRDAVVSLLLPDGEFGPDVIQRFCEFVHFFASPQDGERWVAEHPGTFLLSVDDAYRLGQLTNRAGFGGALASAAQR